MTMQDWIGVALCVAFLIMIGLFTWTLYKWTVEVHAQSLKLGGDHDDSSSDDS